MPSFSHASGAHACNCIGPQNGEPYCPCMMRNVVERDGRWVRPETDLGPVNPQPQPIASPVRGCVCPVGAEKTCKGVLCPRQPLSLEAR